MAHPNFQDRSFAQLLRRALDRISYDIGPVRRSELMAAAKLKDAKSRLGAHPLHSRAADRRWSIYRHAIELARDTVEVA